MAGAVAATTTRIKVGTWVLSALHRNPGIIAKTAETLDEISGGRFVFGLGAGHVWPGQAHAFGLPEDRIFARFEEALRVIVPLMRTGHADFEGEFHAARDLAQRPVGPRPNAIPLLIGGNGPKGQRHAVQHADIWSGYIEERAHIDEMRPTTRGARRRSARSSAAIPPPSAAGWAYRSTRSNRPAGEGRSCPVRPRRSPTACDRSATPASPRPT